MNELDQKERDQELAEAYAQSFGLKTYDAFIACIACGRKSERKDRNKFHEDAALSAKVGKEYLELQTTVTGLTKQLNICKEALDFIAGGCLVPPDGGSPTLQDAISSASIALATVNE